MEKNDPDKTESGLGDTVVLTVTHGGVTIPKTVSAEVAPLLRVTVAKFGPGRPRGHTCRLDAEEFYIACADGGLRAPVGLTERVAAHLRQRGLDPVINDCRRYSDRQQPDLSVLAQSRPCLLLHTAAERPRGIDCILRRDELADRVAALCHLFPRARIAIIETNNAKAEDLYRRLVRPLCSQVLLGREDFWGATVRRVVLTAHRASMLIPDDWDVLIAADAIAVTARGNWPALNHLWGLRGYGFLPANQLLSEREWLRVEAVFGTALVPAARAPGAVAHMAIPPWTPSPPEGISPLERKRLAVWSNTTRNRFISAVAMAITSSDERALATFGLHTLGDDLLTRGRERSMVAILVESPEHGRRLVEHLPGWQLVQHQPRPQRGGWDGWNPIAPLRDPNGFDRSVLTTMAARRIETLDVDVLIRADGSASPLRLPCFPASDRALKRQQILLDIADDFDPVAEADTRERVRDYRSAGWRVVATPQWTETH